MIFDIIVRYNIVMRIYQLTKPIGTQNASNSL